MMQIEIQKTELIDVAFLSAKVGVRYWEDAQVNGEADEDGSLIPCRRADCWCPTIMLESGKVLDWPEGVFASIHYKVCDAGTYTLLDADRNEVVKIDGYVPDIMSPSGASYGDYIIMDIGPDGLIKGWSPTFDEFERAASK